MTARLPIVGGDRNMWGTVANEKFTELEQGVARAEAQLLDVKKYGALGDGVADDTDAFHLAAEEIAGNSGGTGGSDYYIPPGNYRLSETIDPNMPGVRFRGASGWGTNLIATSSLAAGQPLIRLRDNTYINRGPQVMDLQIDMTLSAGNGIEIQGAYDNASMRDILIHGLSGDSNGVSLIPQVAPATDISQSFTATNVQVVGKAGAFTGKAWNVIDMQEATFIACKGIGGAETAGGGTGWYIEGCLGINLMGCSAAKASKGFDVRTRADREGGHVVIDTPTLEGLVNGINIQGNATYKASYVSVRSPRSQVGTSLDGGTITLSYALGCDIESRSHAITIDANSNQNHIITMDRSQITNSGEDTSIIEWANAANVGLSFVGHTRFYSTPTQEAARVSTPGANQTALLVYMNAGGSHGMRWVEVGAVDSGGGGYRMLRVIN